MVGIEKMWRFCFLFQVYYFEGFILCFLYHTRYVAVTLIDTYAA